jgi:hypothetical protein
MLVESLTAVLDPVSLAPRYYNPIADCILVMTCCSGYSTNTPFFGKQCQGSENFIHECVQVKK